MTLPRSALHRNANASDIASLAGRMVAIAGEVNSLETDPIQQPSPASRESIPKADVPV